MCTCCALHEGWHHLFSHWGVMMPCVGRLPVGGNYQERRALVIHLTVTGRCYARCQGCVNAAVTLGVEAERNSLVTAPEAEPERDARAVIELARRCPGTEVVLCFYGGEPLLALEPMAEVVRRLKASEAAARVRYMLITNGELLLAARRRRPELVEALWLLAVSIDGRAAQHNRVRAGTDLGRIHRNLAGLRGRRRGQVLMWSTLRESQSLWDCFAEFQELCAHGLVEHFFWHWAEGVRPMADLSGYLRRYEADLGAIMEHYVKELADGRLMSIIHINELLLYLLTGKERGGTACGVEAAVNFDLLGGKVYACADFPAEATVGEVASDGTLCLRSADLRRLVAYKEELGCRWCGIHAYCGGRCPVQAYIGGLALLQQYCSLMRLHVGVVKEYLPEIVFYLNKHHISLQSIYDRSAYFCQFTDVTP